MAVEVDRQGEQRVDVGAVAVNVPLNRLQYVVDIERGAAAARTI